MSDYLLRPGIPRPVPAKRRPEPWDHPTWARQVYTAAKVVHGHDQERLPKAKRIEWKRLVASELVELYNRAELILMDSHGYRGPGPGPFTLTLLSDEGAAP